MKRWLAGLMAAIITINAVFIFAPLRSDAFVDEIIGEMFGYSYSNFMDAMYGVVDVWTTDKPVQEKWLESEEIIHDNKAMPLVPYAITSYMRNHSGDRSAGTNAPELPADIRGAEDTTPTISTGSENIPSGLFYIWDGVLLVSNESFTPESYPNNYIFVPSQPQLDVYPNGALGVYKQVNPVFKDNISYNYLEDYQVVLNINGRIQAYWVSYDNIYSRIDLFTNYGGKNPNFHFIGANNGYSYSFNLYIYPSMNFDRWYNYDYYIQLLFGLGATREFINESEAKEWLYQNFYLDESKPEDIGGNVYIEYSPKYITNYGDYAPDNSTYYLDYPDSTVENYFNFDNEVNMKNSLVNLIGVLAGALGVLAPVDVDMSLPDLVAKFDDLVGQLNLAFQTGDINANIDRLFDLYNRLDISPYVAIDIGDGDVYNPPDKIPVATGTPTLPPDVKFKLVDKDYLIEYSDDDETNITINIQLPTYEPKGTDFPVYYKYPLTRYFPFSIPYDIYTLLQLFVAEPEAPSFDINVPTYLAANQEQVSEKLVQPNYTTIDLSRFDPVMVYVRPVLLIGAVVGLLLTIKKFMF